MVLLSPVFTDASLGTKIFQFTTTVAERAPVVVVPILLVLQPTGRRLRTGLAVLAVALNLLIGPLDTKFPWQNLFGDAPRIGTLDPFFRSPDFTVGSVYRVLGAEDGKLPMYDVLRHGGSLDSELFPESIHRASFNDGTYTSFVRERKVDYVAVSVDYDRQYHTNEHALLDQLAANPEACRDSGLGVRRIADGPYWFIYRLDRSCS
jgi:hypothetical protein